MPLTTPSVPLSVYDVSRIVHSARCFRSHLGLYAMEACWLTQALGALASGLWPLQARQTPVGDETKLVAPGGAGDPSLQAVSYASQRSYEVYDKGVAMIPIVGPLSKGASKFGGTSTLEVRRALRAAVADEDVKRIVLAIDSPGGQADGCYELAEALWQARQVKPLAAYIEDLGASGAYWFASQAQRITANKPGMIGSIGAFAVLEDISGAMSEKGVSVRVVATGPYKGLGAPGTPHTQALLDETQRQVDQVGALFFAAVRRGRMLSDPRLAAVTDGRLWIADDAVALGLVDGIETLEEAVAAAATLRLSTRVAVNQRERLQALRTQYDVQT